MSPREDSGDRFFKSLHALETPISLYEFQNVGGLIFYGRGLLSEIGVKMFLE